MTDADKDTEKKSKAVLAPAPLKLGAYKDRILVNGVEIEWDTKNGQCTFRGIPVALMWVDSTLAGLMAGVASMVGPERFNLALQSEGRKSVESDWLLISSFQDFREGFAALNLNAAVAGWGDWQVVTYDLENQHCVFRAYNNWEGMYQKSSKLTAGQPRRPSLPKVTPTMSSMWSHRQEASKLKLSICSKLTRPPMLTRRWRWEN